MALLARNNQIALISSKAVAKKDRIYHKMGCIYARRIKNINRKCIPDKDTRKEDCNCKYCGGLKGDVRLLAKYMNKKNITFKYDAWSDTFYLCTDLGFWKIYWKEEERGYLLYHKNTYNKQMEFESAKHGNFHRQKDVKPNASLNSLVDYIIAHDKSKEIIFDDYKKLPQRTKRQKKYYKIAERKVHRHNANRVDNIFKFLEQENKDYKKMSFC